NQPGYTGDYGSAVIPSQTWGWSALDITSLAQGWVNGSYPNYAVMLRANESSGNDSAQLGFMTREAANTNTRPYLSLIFTGVATADQNDRPPAQETPTACGDTIAQRLDTGTETTFGAFRMAHACEP
ncbi:MAG: TGFb propeptide protein, partial [Chloroflexota bacterium]|nr:TGFb propeptide protein [Chloroflexota bacterium]